MSAEARTSLPVQDWEERHEIAAEVFVPWVDGVYPLAGKTVLEYGSGRGCVSCAFGARAERLIGYDIDERLARESRERGAALGIEGLEFHTAAPDEIFARVRAHAGEVDVFLLYAVLEHLTIAERLEALRMAREVVRPAGVIVVIETPNRLTGNDYHTSQLPFFAQLPAELALQYASRSPRPEFRESIEAARDEADGGELTLARWGTGVSFHEFELVFGDLARHVIAGGYEPRLLAERTIHAEELALARELERERPDLPAPFSRYWLDFVLSPEPVEPESVRLFRPWAADTSQSPAAAWTRWETVSLEAGERLAVEAPTSTARAVCVLSCGEPTVEVRARAESTSAVAVAAGEPGSQVVAELALGAPVERFTLEASAPAHYHCVGLELAGAGRG
jgi:predicted nicotinamide N-methyase